MEGEVGAQVAPPVFLHHPHPIRFHETLARKRDFPWQNPNFSYQQRQQQWSPVANPSSDWNSNHWIWDSVGFSAKPSPVPGSSQQTTEGALKVPTLMANQEGDGRNLTLKLGTAEAAAAEARPTKRVRSGSPSSGGGRSYPMCQVDDCQAVLTSAKDYHRRHKVCEVHSKANNALVGRQMQRFCQ